MTSLSLSPSLSLSASLPLSLSLSNCREWSTDLAHLGLCLCLVCLVCLSLSLSLSQSINLSLSLSLSRSPPLTTAASIYFLCIPPPVCLCLPPHNLPYSTRSPTGGGPCLELQADAVDGHPVPVGKGLRDTESHCTDNVLQACVATMATMMALATTRAKTDRQHDGAGNHISKNLRNKACANTIHRGFVH